MKKKDLLIGLLAVVLTFILTSVIVMLTGGCSVEYSSHKYDILDIYDVYVDYDTCVVYFGQWKNGTTPAYNQDGTLKLDNDCLAKMEK